MPPWLKVLQGELDPSPGSGLLVYRRPRPFDPNRLRAWLANPPGELVRGKGHVWLAGEPDQSFGYSCAGSVHRLFPAGRWWASYAAGTWPSCTAQRRRLLERWHPRFGDRRQDLVFVGVDLDLDPDRLCAGLDACLLAEEGIGDGLHGSWEEPCEPLSKPGTRLH
ncbi:MAG: GTP-binding protein [Myxococcota bacterium]